MTPKFFTKYIAYLTVSEICIRKYNKMLFGIKIGPNAIKLTIVVETYNLWLIKFEFYGIFNHDILIVF